MMTDMMKHLECCREVYTFGYSERNEWIHDMSINIHVLRINVPRFRARAAGTVAGMDEDAASS